MKKLKVIRFSQGKGYVPGIRIAGKHLRQFNFDFGDQVSVKHHNGRIIIEKLN